MKQLYDKMKNLAKMDGEGLTIQEQRWLLIESGKIDR